MQGHSEPPAAPSHLPTREAIERFAQAVARLEVDGTWLVEALTQYMRSMQPADPSLSADDWKLLLEGVASSLGIPIREEARTIGRGDLHLKIVKTWLNSVCATLSVDETKAFLQIDDEELIRRVASRHLIPIKLNEELRFPDWQFDPRNPPTKTIRNLPEIFESLEADGAGWQSDAAFMATPQDPLRAAIATPPSQWLRAGGAVSAVLNLIDSRDAW
ncbi:hypothetical protein [Curtobacterium sp. MR_MD2014]|uniref:hypothetical protein n=1 Tax=Curtobacterium sp. MR_MD2014 TaxID=1561023 RepID=UPI00052AA247|nr:hypothetical protein [Curtobacterium sp. MR_MD2014]AIV39176.1 hypothetical protein NI26_00855 [Curtobacterium sp. MR_MD2014]